MSSVFFQSTSDSATSFHFTAVDEVIETIRTRASEQPGCLMVFGDDGEKFGVWPGTYKSVFEEGWLQIFFARAYRGVRLVRNGNARRVGSGKAAGASRDPIDKLPRDDRMGAAQPICKQRSHPSEILDLIATQTGLRFSSLSREPRGSTSYQSTPRPPTWPPE